LILDEIYREMHHGEPLPPAATFSPRVISVASLSKTYGLPGLRLGWLICRDADLMETLLAAKEAMHISHSVVLEELAYAFLLGKDAHVEKTRRDIAAKFGVVKAWMEGQDHLEWVEPSGGVTCFPRLKADLDVDVDKFYEVLNDKYGTYVGPGHWFEVDRRYMRIGFGWPSKDQLEQGLGNITRAIEEAMT
jgi:aspartate/methionine/tyrosine aminotransferase